MILGKACRYKGCGNDGNLVELTDRFGAATLTQCPHMIMQSASGSQSAAPGAMLFFGIFMPVLNRIADFHTEIAAWRRDFHAHPEILFDVHRTAEKVAALLKDFGCDEIVTGMGRTGVVGIINGRTNSSGRTIGLRADMDALPINERTGKDYASTSPGKMHACGHDGHTAMLLGAAKYLAETRNFDGRVAVIFQPAEEGGGGGREMVADGLMDRFDIAEVYGMHNWPGMPLGHFGIREGGIMAATDEFSIEIEGVGGHAARPQNTVDPVMIAAQLITALQTIVSRNVDPLHNAVLSVTVMEAGEAYNVIPRLARLKGTVRTLDPDVRSFIENRIKTLRAAICRDLRRQGERGLSARLSGDGQPRRADGICGRDGGGCGGARPGRSQCRRHRWAARIFPICWKRGRGPIFSSAMATAPNCIPTLMISMTTSFRWAPAIGCGWRSGPCRSAKITFPFA